MNEMGFTSAKERWLLKYNFVIKYCFEKCFPELILIVVEQTNYCY